MPPKSSSLLSTVADKLKPHKAEAIQRIRFNVLVITSVVILSYLLPIPSAFSAVTIPFREINQEAWTIEWFWQWFAVAGAFCCRGLRVHLTLFYSEFALLALCFYNILEAGYALKYPRAPLPPITSPAKAKSQSSSLTTPKRPFKVLSPNVSGSIRYHTYQSDFRYSQAPSHRNHLHFRQQLRPRFHLLH